LDNYFIIEKDLCAINRIKSVLGDYPEFNCIGTSNNYNNAMNIILKETPNLVFFNIDSAIENSFQLVHELNLYSDSFPVFIAISAKKEKAYDSIKNGFSDFLLNPLTELEIRKTVLNFQKKNPTVGKKTICIKSYKDYQYLDTEEILFLKADNNTTDFYMSDGIIISAYKTLKTFEKLLPKNFLRIHKSYIINKNYVSRIQYGKLICTIKKNSYNIPFTKTYIDNIEIMKNTLTGCSYQSLN
jgi:two-component system, LytTR family, response regulator